MTEQRKYRLRPMKIEVGCEHEDEERVVAWIIQILNRKSRVESLPSSPQPGEEGGTEEDVLDE
ncbi:MAG TPA: hypothetical protein VLJ61_15725 [Pyrinomonadaceae bacterium]|nr:hypothetical protein [Pyrinomonadaceae bacterium]